MFQCAYEMNRKLLRIDVSPLRRFPHESAQSVMWNVHCCNRRCRTIFTLHGHAFWWLCIHFLVNSHKMYKSKSGRNQIGIPNQYVSLHGFWIRAAHFHWIGFIAKIDNSRNCCRTFTFNCIKNLMASLVTTLTFDRRVVSLFEVCSHNFVCRNYVNIFTGIWSNVWKMS